MEDFNAFIMTAADTKELVANAKKLMAEMEAVKKTALEAIGKLADSLQELPDNPNIRRIPDTGCFVIRQATLVGGRLDPRYYDYKMQYGKVRDALLRRSPGKIGQWWRETRKKKFFRENKIRIDLHPDVIKALEPLLDAFLPGTPLIKPDPAV